MKQKGGTKTHISPFQFCFRISRFNWFPFGLRMICSLCVWMCSGGMVSELPIAGPLFCFRNLPTDNIEFNYINCLASIHFDSCEKKNKIIKNEKEKKTFKTQCSNQMLFNLPFHWNCGLLRFSISISIHLLAGAQLHQNRLSDKKKISMFALFGNPVDFPNCLPTNGCPFASCAKWPSKLDLL